MSHVPTTTTPQQGSGELQEKPQFDYVQQWLQSTPIWAWGLLFVLGTMLAETIPVWLGVALIIGGYAWNSSIEKKIRMQEAKARAAAWANLIGPVVVGSAHPGETVYDVAERAQFIREQLQLSGNPYFEKIPVIEFPYQPILTAHGQLPAAWSIYQKQIGERQHAENLTWYEKGCPVELKGLFANAVLPAPKMEQAI